MIEKNELERLLLRDPQKRECLSIGFVESWNPSDFKQRPPEGNLFQLGQISRCSRRDTKMVSLICCSLKTQQLLQKPQVT